MIVRSQQEPDKDLYPDDDGLPMSDNSRQYEWMVTIKGNLDALYGEEANVFVGGNLLWYAVEGEPTIRTAPDAMVVFGRPKGDRGSYKQWLEDDIAPQVVFEILSPGNRDADLARKFEFYDRYGVEEYYLYDPYEIVLDGWLRDADGLQPIETMHDWISPRLGIRFDLSGAVLAVYFPNGRRFYPFAEINARYEQEYRRAEQQTQRAEQEYRRAEQQTQRAEQEYQRAEQQTQRAEQERQRAEQQTQRAEQERLRAERFAAQLRALGIEPEA